MKVIIADHDKDAISLFEQQCKQFSYVELNGKFDNAEETLKYASKHKVETAFINIELNGMDGLRLGEKLREINPKMVLVFFTEHTEYTLEALRIKMDAYLIKPYTMEDLTWTMENARLLTRRQKKPVYIRTFGRFDLFINGELVRFSNKKAKELLAVCVDNKGGVVSMEEAIDRLWENRLYDERVKNLYRRAVMDLNKIFSLHGIKDVFVKKRAVCWINYDNVDCDYYRWIEDTSIPGSEKSVGQNVQYRGGGIWLNIHGQRKQMPVSMHIKFMWITRKKYEKIKTGLSRNSLEYQR